MALAFNSSTAGRGRGRAGAEAGAGAAGRGRGRGRRTKTLPNAWRPLGPFCPLEASEQQQGGGRREAGRRAQKSENHEFFSTQSARLIEGKGGEVVTQERFVSVIAMPCSCVQRHPRVRSSSSAVVCGGICSLFSVAHVALVSEVGTCSHWLE